MLQAGRAGAADRDVLRLISGQGMILAAIGMVSDEHATTVA
jgi:hypothetical protein